MGSLNEFEALLKVLGSARGSLVRNVLQEAFTHNEILALVVHGSFSREIADDSSDLDLILVVADLSLTTLANKIRSLLVADPRVAATGRTDRFPWFGHLEAFIFRQPQWFALELGFVGGSSLEQFYIEPNAWILKDCAGRVRRRRAACLAEARTRNRKKLEYLGYELINLTLKFAKSIQRGHLWNAYNYCSVARRMLFDLERTRMYGNDAVFVGLAERRIESELPREVLLECASTAPSYDPEDLVAAFRRALEVLLARWGEELHENVLNSLKESLELVSAPFVIR